jgi:hypothetical protein
MNTFTLADNSAKGTMSLKSDSENLTWYLPEAKTKSIRQAINRALRKSNISVHDYEIDCELKLTQEAGVKLALVVMVCSRVPTGRWTQSIIDGVSVMGDEEALYWYSKCLSEHRNRMQRALAIMFEPDAR